MFRKERFYPVSETKWDPKQALQAIEEILKNTAQSFQREKGVWPGHPQDDFVVDHSLYTGTTGIIWAMEYLKKNTSIESRFDSKSTLERALSELPEQMKNSDHPDNAAYLIGKLPALMMLNQLSHSEERAKEIEDEIEVNHTQPVRELMWGTAGTMLAANLMYQTTKEDRWKKQFCFQAERLLEEWEEIPDAGYLWSPELYGDNRKYLSPVHGLVGNLIPLIKGKEHLSNEKYQEVCTKAMETIVKLAFSNEKHANWQATYHKDYSHLPPANLQYCHGGPGIVVHLSELPKGQNAEFDLLMEKGGELVWDAGASKKGSNLCHGTGGSGYTFLKLFQRTQDEMWLDRARTFAMHSIEQFQRAEKFFQQQRYSLWTGDPGLAVYLENCINAKADFPTIDVF